MWTNSNWTLARRNKSVRKQYCVFIHSLHTVHLLSILSSHNKKILFKQRLHKHPLGILFNFIFTGLFYCSVCYFRIRFASAGQNLYQLRPASCFIYRTSGNGGKCTSQQVIVFTKQDLKTAVCNTVFNLMPETQNIFAHSYVWILHN